jgi:hypothetical protein
LALNYSGSEIPMGTNGTFLGGDGKSYFIRASDMRSYLSKSKVWSNLMPINTNRVNNGVIFQNGFGGGVTGHLDIIYRRKAAYRMYPNPTFLWH